MASSTARSLSGDVNQAVLRCRELTLVNDYETAQSLLDSFNEDDLLPIDQIELHRAAARVLFARGYPLAAKDCIRNALDIFDQHPIEAIRLPLLVHNALVTIVGCGDDLSDDGCLTEVETLFTDQTILDELGIDEIEMLVTVAKVVLMRRMYASRKDENSTVPFASLIAKLLEGANKTCRFHELWLLAIPFSMMEPPSTILDTFQKLLTNPSLPTSLRALISLECANAYEKQSQVPEFLDSLDKADVAFSECGNSLARVQIKLRRLANGSVPSSTVLKDLVDTSNELLQQHYARGFLQMAPLLLQYAFKLGNTDVLVQLHEVFHSVGTLVGLGHELGLLEVHLLAQLNLGGTHSGKVLELGTPLYRNLLDHRLWTPACSAGIVLALAHDQLQNPASSQRYVDEVYDLCRRENLQLESEVAYLKVLIQTNNARARGTLVDPEVTASEKWLSDHAERDFEEGQVLLGCEKDCLLASLYFEQARLIPHGTIEYNRMSTMAKEMLSTVRARCHTLPTPERIRILGNCADTEAVHLVSQTERSGDTDFAKQAEAIYDEVIKEYEGEGLAVEAAIKIMMRGMCKLSRLLKLSNPRTDTALVVSTQADYENATDTFQKFRLRGLALMAHHQMTRIHAMARDWFPGSFPSGFLLDSLMSLEWTADWLRRELSAIGSLDALLEKQKFASKPQVIDLYRWAAGLSIADRNWERLWLWSQKRKARSLADMLGIGVMIPASMRERIAKDEEAAKLLAKYMALTMSLNGDSNETRSSKATPPGSLTGGNTVPEIKNTYTRVHMEEAEAEMDKFPILKEYVTLRDGKVDGVGQLSRLQEYDANLARCRDIIFMDYIVFGDNLYVLTAKASAPKDTLQYHVLPIAASEVPRWIEENFNTDEQRRVCLQQDNLRDATKPLRRLDPLVAPLERASRSGDLVIISTTSVISNIPLHALKITDSSTGRIMPVIQRNPVVYVPSLPVFEFCLARSSEPPQAWSSDQRLFSSVLEDSPSEYQRVQKTLHGLAQKIGGTEICGRAATKEAFQSVLKRARQIHFHGHCLFKAENPLQQALVLAPGEISQGESTPTIEKTFPPQDPNTANNHLDNSKAQHQEQEQQTHPLHTLRTPPILPTLPTDIPPSPSDLLNAQLAAASDGDASYLTTSDLFSTSLPSPLIVLIACNSASQTLSTADEPLGLITGLLSAGAASVVGASWPIPSRVGRAFAEGFWGGGEFEVDVDVDVGEGDGGSGRWVDVAVAVQRAVLRVMDDEEEDALGETFAWGAFCLHGAWGFRVE